MAVRLIRLDCAIKLSSLKISSYELHNKLWKQHKTNDYKKLFFKYNINIL